MINSLKPANIRFLAPPRLVSPLDHLKIETKGDE